MHNVDKLKFWCYKVLPLVYDESLSYYEVLCKMADYINKMAEDIKELAEVYVDIEEYIRSFIESPEVEDLIRDTVVDWLEENQPEPIYNVTYYGILPNSGDVYSGLYALIKDHVTQTGGVVYFPPGKYTISGTIMVPEGTTFRGAGPESEIYYSETDQYFGTALMNAGSNVTIENLKISHKTTGVFHSGAQPGAIGFTDSLLATAEQDAGGHTVYRGPVYNLVARNIVTDGNFAIQTQPSSAGSVTNVVYENINAPDGCVSAKANGNIKNLSIRNINCDLFRIEASSDTTGLFYGLQTMGVCCHTMFISVHADNPDPLVFDNVVQLDGQWNNDIIPEYNSATLKGPCVFRASKFISDSVRYNGIRMYEGIHEFDSCMFNMYSRIFQNMQAASNTNFMVMHDNTITNEINNAGSTLLVGYGSGNYITASNVRNFLFGDMHVQASTGVSSASSYFTNRLCCDGESITIKLFAACTNTTIAELDEGIAALPLVTGPIQFMIGKSTTGEWRPAFGTIDSTGTITNADPITSADSDYNRVMMDTTLELTRRPTPGEIYAAFS